MFLPEGEEIKVGCRNTYVEELHSFHPLPDASTVILIRWLNKIIIINNNSI
jgi:hypothetical protein